MRYPLLSFRELDQYLALVRNEMNLDHSTYRVERIFVPEAKGHPQSYFKHEWVIDLYSPHQNFQLYLSVRAQQCGFALLPAKTLKPCTQASRSGFDLSLHKCLAGSKLSSLKSLKNDRVLQLDFVGSVNTTLFLVFIPNQPDAFLVEKTPDGPALLASSKGSETFTPFVARELTEEQILKIPYREEWLTSVKKYSELWLQAQTEQIKVLRAQKLSTLLTGQSQNLEKKIKSLVEQLTQTQEEPDWNLFGSLLQTHFHAQPQPKNGHYELLNYETNETISVPADPKLNLKQQLERFFHSAKRKKTRLQESAERIRSLEDKLQQTQALLQQLEKAQNIQDLSTIESTIGVGSETKGSSSSSSKEQKKFAAFSGKIFQSKEGLTILVGRNLTENLELSFKIARGNDLWLHVKARPGSHTVILLPPKKTASLDTLLDAANLCILYSGGKDWGKTDVDYTHRKNVKKIKNQTEVSYTQNKTLSVTLDQERLKRLTAD